MKAQHVPLSQAVVRLDGQFGDGAIVADLAGFAYVMRGKDYHLLNQEAVQARLLAPPDAQTTHPESGTQRALFDFPRLHVTPASPPCRVIVATHSASSQTTRIGTTRDNVVYELFFTALPSGAFSAADVVELYLHRGAFETVLSDEDQEQDPDRWCSHTACGQEFWQILWKSDLEPASGTRTCSPSYSHADDRVCKHHPIFTTRIRPLAGLTAFLWTAHLRENVEARQDVGPGLCAPT